MSELIDEANVLIGLLREGNAATSARIVERLLSALEAAEAEREAAVAAIEQLRSGLDSASYYEYKPHKSSSDLVWAIGVINAALDGLPVLGGEGEG